MGEGRVATKSPEQRLLEAEDALHLLLTGTQEVRVQYENTSVQYTTANIDELRRYIALLRGEVDSSKARRPFGVAW
jgi:hypothetical protein